MDKRKEGRIDYNLRFFVHVHSSVEDADMVGMSLTCEAIDISAHGMQFSTNAELTSDTILNITIGVGEPFAMYLLRGEVRWVRDSNDEYLMGVLLQAADDTDFERWLENFDTLFPERN